MESAQSMDETLPMLVGARPKQAIAHEQNRQRMDRSRSNSGGRSILSKRIGHGAEIEMDESTPITPRSGSVEFIDTPIGMGPATALISPRRYSNLGAIGGEGLELIVPPSTMEKEGESADLPYPEPLQGCYTMKDSVSTDARENSALTSVTMDPDYVVLDHNTNTVIQPPEGINLPPTASATGAAGIRRISSGTNHPSMDGH